MLLVPIKNDKIETTAGVKHVVLSFAKYKSGPAVFVEGEAGVAVPILFDEIIKIGGSAVELLSSGVFLSVGKVHRVNQLPQLNDVVTVGSKQIKVKTLRLTGKNLTDGMLVVGQDAANEENTNAKVVSITSIKRDASMPFSSSIFRRMYSEYLGAAV